MGKQGQTIAQKIIIYSMLCTVNTCTLWNQVIQGLGGGIEACDRNYIYACFKVHSQLGYYFWDKGTKD